MISDESAPSELAQTITQLWQDALCLNTINRDDNFFELGGHSLLLTQIVAQLRKQLTLDLSISAFFNAPTIAGWLDIIEATHTKAIPHVTPLKRSDYKISLTDLNTKIGQTG